VLEPGLSSPAPAARPIRSQKATAFNQPLAAVVAQAWSATDTTSHRCAAFSAGGCWAIASHPQLQCRCGRCWCWGVALTRGRPAGSSCSGPGARPMLLVRCSGAWQPASDQLGRSSTRRLAPGVACSTWRVARRLLTPAVFRPRPLGSLSTAGTWRQHWPAKHCWQLLLYCVCGLMGCGRHGHQIGGARSTAVVPCVLRSRG